MLSTEYKYLISQIVDLTNKNRISWSKYDSQNSLVCITDGRKIVIDKYFSKKDGTDITCFNFSILKSNDSLVDEIVYCNNVPDLSDYSILENMYTTIESKYLDNGINSEIRKISQSLSHD